MFGRIDKAILPPGDGVSRPEVAASSALVNSVSNGDLQAATQLMTGNLYSNDVWAEVLMTHVLIAHFSPSVQERFSKWIEFASEPRQPALRRVARASETLLVSWLDNLNAEDAFSAHCGLALAIGDDELGLARHSQWTLTGVPLFENELN